MIDLDETRAALDESRAYLDRTAGAHRARLARTDAALNDTAELLAIIRDEFPDEATCREAPIPMAELVGGSR